MISFILSFFKLVPKKQKVFNPSKKEITLKIIIKNLISLFGIRDINNALAEIYHDKYKETSNIYYDNLSEGYDDINKDIIFFGD